MPRALRWRGGVEQQGSHQQESASFHNAAHLTHSPTPFFDVRGADLTGAVGTGQYADGAVLRTAVVEVHPDGYHALQDADRRLHVGNASLRTPRAVTLDVTASPDVLTTTSYEVDCDLLKRVGPKVSGSTPLARPIAIPSGAYPAPPGAVQCFITARATKPASGSMTLKLLVRAPRAR